MSSPQAMGLIALPPSENVKQQHFEDLQYFLQDIFHEPDMEAIKILLSIYVSHFYIQEKPIWSFLLGPSGSGKSEIGIRSLEHLHGVTTVTELTPATFLSAYGENNGLLHRLSKENGGNGIIVFSDLTTLLNKQPNIRSEVIGILRRLYDGSYEKDVGNRKSQMKWQGKLTCIAACTPALEKYWSIHRSLGERFLTLHWRRGDSRAAMLKAINQIGLEHDNQVEFKKLVRRFVQQESPHGIDRVITEAEKLFPIAKMVAWMRIEVDREQFSTKRSITGLSEMESPTRIVKSLTNLIRASASLFRRKQACKEDYALALRLGIDSINRNRLRVVREVMKYPDMAASADDVRQSLVHIIARSSCRIVIEDLIYTQVLKQEKVGSDIFISPTQQFHDLWQETTAGCLDKFYEGAVDLGQG